MSEHQTETSQTEQPIRRSHNGVVIKSVLAVVGMLAFVFVGLVPMYNLICEWTGITGRTTEASAVQEFVIAEDRPIKVQFLASNNADMPWEFKPMVKQVTAKPGELVQVSFYARNTTRRAMTAQAIPSLAPFESTPYFHKTECFCFNQQPLAAGEDVEMGLVFQIDPDLPDWVKTISLSYTLYDVTEKQEVASASTH